MEDVFLSPIPRAELVRDIAQAVRAEIAALPSTPPEPEELLTREQAAQLLRITLPTLRSYTRQGLVNGYRIASRVRYKRSEVLGSLAPIRQRKPQRP